MRIGLNLLYMIPGEVGGTETYAAGLLDGLARVGGNHEYFVFVNRESADFPLPRVPGFTRLVCPIWSADRKKRYLFEQGKLPRLLSTHHVDVVHSLGYVGPLFAPVPSVVTVHDLNYRTLGMYMPVVRRTMLALFVSQSIRRANRVITVSQFSKREIMQAFRLPSERIVVTHEAPGPVSTEAHALPHTRAILAQLGINDPYIVAFGSHGPNKNIGRLMQAFLGLKARNCLPHQLVLVGHLPARDTLPRFSEGEIRMTGYLDSDILQMVLSSAQLLVFPSFYEGFGLPPLEAMACGVPVACSDRGPMPEVAGEAAVFFDPFSVEDMGEKIRQLATDPSLSSDLVQKGYRNLQRFSWEKTARQTLEVYSDAIAGAAR